MSHLEPYVWLCPLLEQINSTWGQECDLLLFMTTKHQAGLNTIVLSLGEDEARHFLWRKSVMSWSLMYAHLLDKYDWFIRADDDTFFNMDNLRGFLEGVLMRVSE